MSEGFTIPDVLDGDRIDRAVALLTGWSRAEVQALLSEELVLVGGRVVAKSHRVSVGDVIELLGDPQPDAPPVGEPVPIEVRYEDDHVVVVAKPAGLVVHPGAGHGTGTLVHGLLHRYPEMAAVGDPFRPGIVHRLDRDTSGLLVAARTEPAYRSLVQQLSTRSVERLYDALVWGVPASSRGVIDAPIGRSSHRRTRMAVRDDGRDARTQYQMTRSWRRPEVAALECRLETGRTHQIRVHLAAIGHPVVGDATYGGYRENIALTRPFLHARILGFEHPLTAVAVRVEEPLPRELVDVLEELD
jgi:23S rRNA pseudouridine1911/1915/1917 synthase